MKYSDYITSANRQTNFIKIVDELTQSFIDLQGINLDLSVNTASGALLDVLGQWVGASREVSTPLANVYFAWDSSAIVGWDSGVWRDVFDNSTSLTILPDDSYRILIKSKIAASRWDATAEDAYKIWENLFSESFIIITDNNNMSCNIAVAGAKLDSVTLALLVSEQIALKPAGVKTKYYQISVDGGALFSWDVANDALAGWDVGGWAQEILN